MCIDKWPPQHDLAVRHTGAIAPTGTHVHMIRDYVSIPIFSSKLQTLEDIKKINQC